MKTLKKALSVILGLAIMLSCVMGMQVSVAAEGTNLKLAVGKATVDGTTVKVPVNVVTNPGFAQLAVEVNYDANVLELVSGDKNKAFSDSVDAGAFGPTTANPFRMMWAFWGVDGTEANGNANITATDTIATLTFKVVDDTVGTTNIDIEVTEAWDVNGDDVAATATATGGTVNFVTEPECEHDWDVVSATTATGTGSSGNYATTETGTIELICSKCGLEDTQAVYYDERSRTNETIISLGAEISITAKAFEKDLNRVGNLINGVASSTTDEWNNFFCKMVVATKTSGDVPVYYEMEDTTLSANDSSYSFTYGVAPYMLGDDITIEFYTYNVDDERWYSGTVVVTSVLKYIQKNIPSADEITKKLMADLLSYGAAAQKNNNYNEEDLLTDYLVINSVDYSSYITTGTATVSNDRVWATSSSAQYPVTFGTLNAVCSSKVYFDIGFQFGNSYYANYTGEYDDLYVIVKYTNLLGQEVPVTFYNAASHPDAENTFVLQDGVRKFAFDFDTFNAGDMREKLNFEIYKGDGTKLNAETIYSVQSAVYALNNNQSTNAETLELLNEMIQFGDSARAFLISTNS